MLQSRSIQSRTLTQTRSRRHQTTVKVEAFFNFGKKKAEAVEEPVEKLIAKKKRKESVVAQTLSALDFAAPRSQKDADLLYEAKYGARGEDGKMTREQYGALRRKIGGTAKDYWKDWIAADVQEPTAITESGASVPFLPLLLGVTAAVIGTTVWISTL